MKDHKLKVILFSTCDDTYEDIKIKSKDSAPGLSLMIFWTSKQFKAGVAEKTFANTLVNCWGCETVHSGAYVCGLYCVWLWCRVDNYNSFIFYFLMKLMKSFSLDVIL